MKLEILAAIQILERLVKHLPEKEATEAQLALLKILKNVNKLEEVKING